LLRLGSDARAHFSSFGSAAIPNDTVENFNEACAESGIELTAKLALSTDQRPLPTPWQRVYSQYNQRAGDSDLVPLRRWVNLKPQNPRYDVLHLQELSWSGPPDELYSKQNSEVSAGYFITRYNEFVASRRYAVDVLHFDGIDMRECTQTETNSALRSLALSAYTFSHDPESTITSNQAIFRPSPTLWDT
jgi:hypothetical protein